MLKPFLQHQHSFHANESVIFAEIVKISWKMCQIRRKMCQLLPKSIGKVAKIAERLEKSVKEMLRIFYCGRIVLQVGLFLLVGGENDGRTLQK